MIDQDLMWRALDLAEKGRPTTSPNPMVGAIVVRDGVIVGEGWHQKAGEPHAEPIALDAAGDLAKGATLYVTLEPCCHHGRTPPCTDRIIRSGISHVVAAMADPFPQVSGKGFETLRQAGISVTTGILEIEARKLNEAYLKRIATGVPWVTVKAAITLDGKMATRSGDSKWITGEAARAEAHRLRSMHNVVLVGIGTVLADDPLLTCRLPEANHQPWRAVLDSNGQLPITSQLVKTASVDSPVVQFVREDTKVPRLSDYVETIQVKGNDTGLDMSAVLKSLADKGANSVLAEGGPRVLSSLIRGGYADRAAIFIAPRILGDEEAPSFIGGAGPERITDCLNLKEVTVRRFGDDILIEGYLPCRKEG